MVIVLTGIVIAIVGRFMVGPIQGYLSLGARSVLTDTADGALRRIGRELRAALPNSVRVSSDGLNLEFIPATGAARYTTAGSDPLDFANIDTSFALVGPPLTVSAAQTLVFYNLGPGVTGADAYADNSTASAQATSNRRSATNAAGSTSSLSISSLAPLPPNSQAAPYRVFAVSPPVSYRCDLTAGTLTRLTGYGFLASQPSPPTGGSSALVAGGVTACRFSADGTVIATRAGLVQLALTLSTATVYGTESVSLHHAVHVDNLP